MDGGVGKVPSGDFALVDVAVGHLKKKHTISFRGHCNSAILITALGFKN